MIDNIDNVIQVTAVGICGVISFARAISSRKREWLLLGLFYAAAFAGTLYWMIYAGLYEEKTPYDPFIAYLSWYTSYYFLILVLLYIKGGKLLKLPPPFMLYVPAFTVGMFAYYITFGSVLSNFITLVLMTILIWNAVDGQLLIRGGEEPDKNKGPFYQMVLIFCTAEYLLWTASCIWSGDTITNPYYVFDMALSVCYVLFVPAMRKAAGA